MMAQNSEWHSVFIQTIFQRKATTGTNYNNFFIILLILLNILDVNHSFNPFTALPRVMLGVNTASYTPVPRVWLGLNMG